MTQHKKLFVVKKTIVDFFKEKGLSMKKGYELSLNDVVRNYIIQDINNQLIDNKKELDNKINGLVQ